MNRVFEAVVDIDRILVAVDNVPTDLDRDQLVVDLEKVKRDYAIEVYVREAPAERRKSLSALIAAAEEFKRRIGEWEGNYYLYRHIRTVPPLAPLIRDAKGLMLHMRKGHGAPRPIDGVIAQVYRVLKKHLGEDAVRIKQGVRGDFPHLAVVALKEMGIDNNGRPYAPKTIANALAIRGRSLR